jgi:hypothetical protein
MTVKVGSETGKVRAETRILIVGLKNLHRPLPGLTGSLFHNFPAANRILYIKQII